MSTCAGVDTILAGMRQTNSVASSRPSPTNDEARLAAPVRAYFPRRSGQNLQGGRPAIGHPALPLSIREVREMDPAIPAANASPLAVENARPGGRAWSAPQ